MYDRGGGLSASGLELAELAETHAWQWSRGPPSLNGGWSRSGFLAFFPDLCSSPCRAIDAGARQLARQLARGIPVLLGSYCNRSDLPTNMLTAASSRMSRRGCVVFSAPCTLVAEIVTGELPLFRASVWGIVHFCVLLCRRGSSENMTVLPSPKKYRVDCGWLDTQLFSPGGGQLRERSGDDTPPPRLGVIIQCMIKLSCTAPCRTVDSAARPRLPSMQIRRSLKCSGFCW